MLDRWSNLPQSALENMSDLGKKIADAESIVREKLNIPADKKVSLTRCVDGSVKVFVDKICLGNVEVDVDKL